MTLNILVEHLRYLSVDEVWWCFFSFSLCVISGNISCGLFVFWYLFQCLYWTRQMIRIFNRVAEKRWARLWQNSWLTRSWSLQVLHSYIQWEMSCYVIILCPFPVLCDILLPFLVYGYSFRVRVCLPVNWYSTGVETIHPSPFLVFLLLFFLLVCILWLFWVFCMCGLSISFFFSC